MITHKYKTQVTGFWVIQAQWSSAAPALSPEGAFSLPKGAVEPGAAPSAQLESSSNTDWDRL